LEHRLHHDLWTTKQHHDLSTNAKKKSLQRREYQLPLRERERVNKTKKFPLIPNCKTPNTNLLQFHTFAVASKQSIRSQDFQGKEASSRHQCSCRCCFCHCHCPGCCCCCHCPFFIWVGVMLFFCVFWGKELGSRSKM
jgi:hypothetical protein